MAKSERATDCHLDALVRRAQDGDRGAAGQALSQVQHLLRGRVARVLPEGEVDDAVQDSLLKIFTALQRFDFARGVRFTTWCCTIAMNHCRDLLRRRRCARAVTSVAVLEVPDRSLDPARSASGRELLERYDRARSRLPVEQRTLLAMREQRGMSYRELGEELGVPTATIRTRLNRLRRKLRAQVGSELLAEAV